MTLDEAIKRYTSNAEYERTHGNLQGCSDFKQLAAWLRELKAYRDKSQERDGKEMNDSFELTLNNPLTKEDWDKIADVELENTPSITFQTPKGKRVKYIKSEVLDKIAAEIKEKENALDCMKFSDVALKVAYIEALKIIDKYKAESGGED